MASNDPSASEPVAVRIGDTIQVITGSLSTTKNAGTNWCNSGSSELATNAVDYFVYLIQETGGSVGTKIGFSRVPYATTMNDFVNTTTSEKYIAGNWTNFNTSDIVTVIGRFAATLSAGAGYTWSSPGTVINRPIYESQTLTYAPTVSPFSGSFTALGTVSGKYFISMSRVTIFVSFAITTNGTAGGFITTTIPFTTAGGAINVASGKETAVVGKFMPGTNQNSASIAWIFYDNAYPGGDGYSLVGNGFSMSLV